MGCKSGCCRLSSSGRTSPGLMASSEWRRMSRPNTAACRTTPHHTTAQHVRAVEDGKNQSPVSITGMLHQWRGPREAHAWQQVHPKQNTARLTAKRLGICLNHGGVNPLLLPHIHACLSTAQQPTILSCCSSTYNLPAESTVCHYQV